MKVCCSADGLEETVIGYNVADAKLKIDTTRTGANQHLGKTVTGTLKKSVESAPMKLRPNEPLKLRVFLDRSIVEVFANDGRLALSRVIYPSKGSTGIQLYAKGGAATVKSVAVWDIMPTNPY